MFNIKFKDRRTDICVRKMTKVIDMISDVRKVKWSWAGHISPSKTTNGPRVSPLRDHTLCLWQEKTTRETSQAVARQPGQIQEGHDLAEYSTRQVNLEEAC